MAATDYAATSYKDFPAFQHRYGKFTPDKWHASASTGTEIHLPALRLVLTKPNNKPDIIPSFAQDHDHACPRCHETEQLNHERLDYAMQDITTKSLLLKSGAELHNMPFPAFWTCLAHCVREGYRPLTKSYALRPRPSNTAAQQPESGSSSSPRLPPSSEYSADLPFDEDVFENLRNVPESLTNHLAHAAADYALYCLHQPDPDAEICARPQEVRYTAQLGPATVTSCDDGGLAYYQKRPGTWFVTDLCVAIRESKIASDNVAYHQSTNEIYPVITNKILAQYLLEAVTAMRADPLRPRSDIILIAHCSVFSRFIHFHAGDKYHAFLDAKSDADREALVDMYPEETCIHMTATRWLCLLNHSDRGFHFCNVFCIVRAYRPPSPAPNSPSEADPDPDPGTHGNLDGVHDDDDNNTDESTASQVLPPLPNDNRNDNRPISKRKRKQQSSSDSSYAP